jgi:DNA invertase Pin-like site-specific DNA recombinase
MERELVKEHTIAGLAAARAKGGTGGGRNSNDARQIYTARKRLAAGDKPAKIAKLLQVGLSTSIAIAGQRRPSRLRILIGTVVALRPDDCWKPLRL